MLFITGVLQICKNSITACQPAQVNTEMKFLQQANFLHVKGVCYHISHSRLRRDDCVNDHGFIDFNFRGHGYECQWKPCFFSAFI